MSVRRPSGSPTLVMFNLKVTKMATAKTLRLLTNHKSHVTVAVPIVYIQSVYAPHVESPLPHFDWL